VKALVRWSVWLVVIAVTLITAELMARVDDWVRSGIPLFGAQRSAAPGFAGPSRPAIRAFSKMEIE
jgi:hypothetical protein